jgi:NAD(P)H-dependent FMN reductase
MLNLQVIVCSTRPGRVGPAIGAWMLQQARAHGQFDAGLLDLAEFNLPVFDEPHHPRHATYEHDHTKRWSAAVARGDAYVFVTPEYNFSTPAPLLNALTYLYHEWTYKPMAFASYGGASGGMRGVQMTKHVVTTLKMVPIQEAVTLTGVSKQIDAETKSFVPTEANDKAARTMLDELHRWTVALKTMRG